MWDDYSSVKKVKINNGFSFTWTNVRRVDDVVEESACDRWLKGNRLVVLVKQKVAQRSQQTQRVRDEQKAKVYAKRISADLLLAKDNKRECVHRKSDHKNNEICPRYEELTICRHCMITTFYDWNREIGLICQDLQAKCGATISWLLILNQFRRYNTKQPKIFFHILFKFLQTCLIGKEGGMILIAWTLWYSCLFLNFQVLFQSSKKSSKKTKNGNCFGRVVFWS